MLPILLILLLGAIDFGRLFFSWVTLHQAARIGANHASIDPRTTSAEIPDIIQTETDVMNCALGTPTLQYTSGGTVITNPQLGDYAHVTLTCDFSLITPLAGFLFGDPVHMTAVSAFPVRAGALGIGGGGGSPPPPPPEQCRTIPDLEGMSIGGARLAWESAGFVGAFTSSDSDTQTVDTNPGAIVVNPLDPSCPDPLAIFNASITVSGLPVEGSPPGPTDCEVIPNFIGVTVADARDAWDSGNFIGEFLPALPDDDPDAVVEGQVTSQSGSEVTSEPGVTCMDLATSIEVSVGGPWAEPPAAPCQVPHLIDKTRPEGETQWYANLFAPGTFSPTNGSWQIKSQSLVGLTWAPCDSQITVSQQP